MSDSTEKALAVCLPIHKALSYQTFQCYDAWRRNTTAPAGWKWIYPITASSSPVSMTREAIVEELLTNKVYDDPRPEILLWIDADCGFEDPMDFWRLVDRLDKAPPQVGILGAPCRVRGEGDPQVNVSHFPGGTAWYSYDGTEKGLLGNHLSLATPGKPFAVVEAVGFGIVAMRRSVFDGLARPWFDFRWKDPIPAGATVFTSMVGEDMGFCRRIRKEKGLMVCVDWSLPGWHLIEQRAKLPPEWTVRKQEEVTW